MNEKAPDLEFENVYHKYNLPLPDDFELCDRDRAFMKSQKEFAYEMYIAGRRSIKADSIMPTHDDLLKFLGSPIDREYDGNGEEVEIYPDYEDLARYIRDFINNKLAGD